MTAATPAPGDGRQVGVGAAPGKVILTGEHAVVYGHPAVALAVTRQTTVRLTRRQGPSAVGHSIGQDDRLHDALFRVLPREGLTIDIETELPVGRGMGSSAALAVAVVRALADLEGRPCTFEDCFELGMRMERVFHGNPSGLDHTVSARGGAVRFQRTVDGPQITPLSTPPLTLVVIDSGFAGDTGQLVQGVAARRPEIDPILEDMGALSQQIIATLERGQGGAHLGQLMSENQRLLARIGVSHPVVDDIIDTVLTAGALGAKLSGAGGGGIVIALCDDPAPVLGAARRAGYTAFPVSVLEP